MGGDGTINEVINGMVPVRSDSCFGFIPFGTVNDLARALHIPRSPQGAIRMLEQAKRTTIDVGKINDRYFINIVAAGLIPEAVSEVTIKEKTLFGSLAYFMKGFQALPKQHSYHFHIREENGTDIHISSPLVAAMLTDSAGSFRNLVPPEERNKGVIKLALFHNFQWLRTIREAPKLLTGLQLGPEILTVVGVKKAHISISNEEELITNVDGEKGPSFPIDLEILPDRLSVFVPEKIKEDNSLFPHLLEGIQPKLRLPWAESADEDMERIANSGYEPDSHEKLWFDQDKAYTSLYFMNMKLPDNAMEDAVSRLMSDSKCGRIFRVKGFMQNAEGKWLELNATHKNITVKPIERGQAVFIVIGEGLDKEHIDGYFVPV